MFRFSIRELMLITLVVGLGMAWAREHQSFVAVREDAKYLARYGDPHSGACSQIANPWELTASKYKVTASEFQQMLRDTEKELDATPALPKN